MPWSRVLAFSDPFPCQVAIQAADVEVFPTAKGGFCAEVTQIGMNRLWMQRFHVNLPHVNAVRMMSSRAVVGFLTDEHQRSMQHCGRKVSPGDIIFNDFDVAHQQFGSDVRFGSMSLMRHDLDSACKALTGREFSEARRKHLVRPGSDLMTRLLRLHKTAGQIAKSSPEILASPESMRAIEQALVHALINCLTEGASSEPTALGRRRDSIVAKFEEFLEAKPDQPIYLAEICATIGVAERTLRSCCEEHLGMGPIRYLTLRRMHLVRHALLRANHGSATVTRVATDHGFWELGRFAVVYRAMFGESPLASLKRPPNDGTIFLNRPSSLESPRIVC